MDSTVIPIIENCIVIFATSLVIIFVLINGYILIRKQFPVKVNCWFCNTTTHVAYEQTNSFDCPSCNQYNGFTPDGNYNKYIPEQYEPNLNPQINASNKASKNGENDGNGLCNSCNFNQFLKVKQLANFVPLNENNYDTEIQAYQKQLEEYYALCKKCENVLKITLSVQNSWYIGNAVHYMQKMHKSGMKLFDLNKSSHGMSVSYKHKIVMKIMKLIQIIFVLFISYNNFFVKAVYSKVDLSKLDISEYFPNFLLPYFHIVEQLWNTLVNTTFETTKNVMDSQEVNNIIQFLPKDLHLVKYNSASFSILGLILEIFAYIMESKLNKKLYNLLPWVGLSFVSWIPGNSTYNIYTHVVQHQLSVFILYSLIFKGIIAKFSKKSPRFIKKKLKKKYESYEDCSDIDEIDENCSTKYSNSKSSSYITGRCNTSKLADLEITQKVLQKLKGHNSSASITSSKIKNSPNSVSNSLNNSTDISLNNSNSSNSNSIHKSLDNLHLGSSRKRISNPLFQRPLISPPRLSYLPNTTDHLNISRSSSNSSGFVSQKNLNFNTLNHNSSLPNSRRNSFSGDAGSLFYKKQPNSRKNSLSGESDNSSSSELGRIHSNINENSNIKRRYVNLNSPNGFDNINGFHKAVSPTMNYYNTSNNYTELGKKSNNQFLTANLSDHNLVCSSPSSYDRQMCSPTSSVYGRYNPLNMNQGGFTSIGSSTVPQMPLQPSSSIYTATSPAKESNVINSIYRKDNTFYPLLNHSNMLYIQANRNPQGNFDTNTYQSQPYISKLFKMDSLLNHKNNSLSHSDMECDNISEHITSKFKLD